MSERKYWLVTLVLLLIVIVNFCNPPAGSTNSPTQTIVVATQTTSFQTAALPTARADVLGSTAGGSDDFLAKMRAKGLKVELTGQVQQPLMPIPGDIVIINGASVQIFEFANEEAQKEAAARILKDGGQASDSAAGWAGQPTFWASERIIVLYLGKSSALIEPISEILGKPVTIPAVAE